MSGVQVRHLAALVALVEEGTFTDAAIRLGVGQSAVSRTLADLERLLGAELVRRTTRTLTVTDRGAATYRAAVAALAALDEVVDAARDRMRPLRLGFSWSALGRHTSAVLGRWRAMREDVALEVHRIDERDAGLGRGSVDVGVIRGPVDDPGLSSERIFTEQRMAALPVGHPLTRSGELHLSDLAEHTVLLTSTGTTTLALWPADRGPRTLLVDNADEWLTEIAGGLAVGVTTESTAAQHAHPDVCFVPISGAPPVDVRLAWPSAHPHPAVAEFVRVVLEVIGPATVPLPR